jgi:hypothetical protein
MIASFCSIASRQRTDSVNNNMSIYEACDVTISTVDGWSTIVGCRRRLGGV